MSNGIYERIRAGELVPVHNGRGFHFSIQHELMHGCIHCYSVVVNGKRQRGHNRLMLDQATARDWCENVFEDIAIEEK